MLRVRIVLQRSPAVCSDECSLRAKGYGTRSRRAPMPPCAGRTDLKPNGANALAYAYSVVDQGGTVCIAHIYKPSGPSEGVLQQKPPPVLRDPSPSSSSKIVNAPCS